MNDGSFRHKDERLNSDNGNYDREETIVLPHAGNKYLILGVL